MISIWHWHNEPLLVGSIVLYLWFFLIYAGPIREKYKLSSYYPKTELYWQLAGVFSFYVAIGSPLDAIGENFLFSAHMVQHNLLMYVCPVFFILGTPSWMIDSILNNSRFLKFTMKFLLHPIITAILFTLAFSVWHFPFLYEAALHSKPIHVMEHLTMFFPSILLWWLVCGKSKILQPLKPGGRMIFMFFVMFGQTPVFAFLAFSADVLYPTYEYAPRIIDLSPLQDQITGAIIMKIAGMIAAFSVIGHSFYLWAKENS